MLTDEQAEVVRCEEREFVVSACAGSGKTHTLIEYAKARPRVQMLYLAYNRAIKEDAARRFPGNTRCVTTHGVAYNRFGKYFKNKLGNLKAYHLSSFLEVQMTVAGHVVNAITNFLVSADKEIGETHTRGDLANANDADKIVALAKRAWAAMQDVSNAAVPMPHDGYLKLFQLSKAVIPNIEVILFDEVQDSNSVTQAIIANQPCRKVFVGDSRQSIYAFRGANDTLNTIRSKRRLSLTNSFRFGDGVAMLANAVLGEFQEHKDLITGLGKHKTCFAVDRSKPHTVLCRTNGMLFSEAVSALQAGVPFGFVGGVQHYRFDNVLDAYWLKSGNKGAIRDKFIQSFGDFTEMAAYAEAVDDRELLFLAKVVKDYGSAIPDLVKSIQERAVALETWQHGAIAMTTGHRSKGLEWLDVVLTEDFTDMTPRKDPKTQKDVAPDIQEINLLYVAATRAQRGLQLPDNLREWIDGANPALSKLIRQRNKPGNADEKPLPVTGQGVVIPEEPEPAPPSAGAYLNATISALQALTPAKRLALLHKMAEQFADEATGCAKGNPARANTLGLASGLLSMIASNQLDLFTATGKSR